MTDVSGVGGLLEVALESMGLVRIAVVGDFCVDAYWRLSDAATETSLETGLPVQRVREQAYSLGGASNVAANLCALGVGEVRAIGVHGQDPFGAILRTLLRDAGANIAQLQDLGADWQTLVYAKPYLGTQELARLDFGTTDPLPVEALRLLLDNVSDAAEWAHVVVINQQVASGFNHSELIAGVNEIIAAHPETVFLVDARTAASQYVGAVLKVNSGEAAALLDIDYDGTMSDVQAEACARMINQRTGHAVVITRGERGLVAADHDGVYRALGVEITEQVDPVGAGDTVVAAIAALLATGTKISAAAQVANLAASVTVRKVHTTGTVTPTELRLAATTANYVYSADLANNPLAATILAGTDFEVIGAAKASQPPRHIIFDHDGTLSTLRQGWEQVMEPMMIDAILPREHGQEHPEAYEQVRLSVRDLVDRTTGVQTLVQMRGLVELVRRFGLVPEEDILDERGYKALYNAELMRVVDARLAKISSGHLAKEDFHIKNALPLLQRLHAHGIRLYLASGTDVDDVVAEASALGFAEFFEGRIYGSVGKLNVEAKKVVMDQIVADHGVDSSELVTFGDGPVEMRETTRRGGFAIGVCSDERQRHGFNPAKRARLIRGGASVLIPDFSDLQSVLALLRLT